jgi:hypothetical protein
MKYHISIALAVLMSIPGCDAGRVDKLEKENAELKAALAKSNAASDFELQQKCSNAAKNWFRENFPADKDTILLDQNNHYNKKMNKCFVFVEYHYTMGRDPSWYNDMTMWDVFENSKYASFAELHTIYPFNSKLSPEDKIITCEVTGTKCKTLAEFNNMTHSYLND